MGYVKLTNHARKRWQQRFAKLNISEQYSNAGRPNKKLLKQIKATCPGHHHCRKSRTSNGRYFRATKDGIVFVVAPPETIITILDYRS